PGLRGRPVAVTLARTIGICPRLPLEGNGYRVPSARMMSGCRPTNCCASAPIRLTSAETGYVPVGPCKTCDHASTDRVNEPRENDWDGAPRLPKSSHARPNGHQHIWRQSNQFRCKRTKAVAGGTRSLFAYPVFTHTPKM